MDMYEEPVDEDHSEGLTVKVGGGLMEGDEGEKMGQL